MVWCAKIILGVWLEFIPKPTGRVQWDPKSTPRSHRLQAVGLESA